MDRPPGLLLIERDSAGCPALGHDDWGDGLRELIADRGTCQQPLRDQLAEQAREVVDRADGRGDGAALAVLLVPASGDRRMRYVS